MGQKQHSKRQRKQKANASLKRKQAQRQDHDSDIHIDPPRTCVASLSLRIALIFLRLTVANRHAESWPTATL